MCRWPGGNLLDRRLQVRKNLIAIKPFALRQIWFIVRGLISGSDRFAYGALVLPLAEANFATAIPILE